MQFFSYELLRFLYYAVINRTEKGILVIFLHILFIGSFTNSCARFSVFHAGNVILFQIKANAKNIKETTLAMYFIKVTTRPSFTRLRVITGINRFHMKIENMLQRFSCISFLSKPPWLHSNKNVLEARCYQVCILSNVFH